MSYVFDPRHHQFFMENLQLGAWRARDATPWVRSVKGVADLGAEASAEPLTRDRLMALASDRGVTDRDVLWAILAWGGMRRTAAARLAANEAGWACIVGRLRRDGLDRQASYRLCHAMALGVRAGGIGPAYFTKLIFFANPRHDGSIMDQWTSRSINLLVVGAPVVRMRTANHVDPRNDAATYERFCGAIERLAARDGRSPAYIEQCLFSTGGRSPAPWRKHVMVNG